MINIQYSKESYKDVLTQGISYKGEQINKALDDSHYDLKNAILGFFMQGDTNSIASKTLQTVVRDLLTGSYKFIPESKRHRLKKFFSESYIRSAAELENIQLKITKALYATDSKDALNLLGIAEFELRDTLSRLRQQIRQNNEL